MITIPANARLYIYQHPISMRKSFEGLSKIIEEIFPNELLSGSFFIFLNRKKDHMKVLVWDGDGLLIYFKRLEKGRYQWKWGDSQKIDRRTFLMLLEGVIPKRLIGRFSL